MNGENIRVLARVLLIGKNKSANAVAAFSALLRLAVFYLVYLYLKNFSEFLHSFTGKTVLVIGAATVTAALILLECIRNVKDRWYDCIKTGYSCSFSELTVSFGLADLLFALLGALVSLQASVLRFVVFFFVPMGGLFITVKLVAYGVSNAMLVVLVIGNVLLFCSALLFWLVSLNCVSLARSLCVSDIKRFYSVLHTLDKYAFRFFKFGIPLSVVNRGSRRLAKIMYADLVCFKL